ncbi:YsnF/AvaK domain-containing protein [Pontibacter russatus]|uniref:YsnF/AvaK domain-containing protein n=1 Tax=Pontibacter russatus TaxID=2694929 RepID=UPI001379A867|nr:YsnF/AvaK domain-containing protein [Pontibacter russatus]
MKNREDKIQSEFEQKLRESELSATREDSAVREPDADRRLDSARENVYDDRDSAVRANARSNEAQPDYIPVVEEQVRINKKTVETGRVNIYKDVHEEDVTVDVPTVHEEVNVERVPINEFVESAPPSVRYEGDVMIIPVLHEELVLVKRLKLVEELHVTKRKIETHEAQHVTLRKEEVNVNRVEPGGENPGRA